MDINKQKIKDLGDEKKYEDLGGMTAEKLQLGLWYVEHLKQFRLWIIIFLSIIAVVFWAYTLYSFTVYIVQGMKDDESLIRAMAKTSGSSHNNILKLAPVDLEVSPAAMLRSEEKRIDFFSKISNLNQNHWGEFTYYFLIGSVESEKMRGFIYPGEEKYLMALGQEIETQTSAAQIKIEELSWHKINRHKIADWKKFRDNHLAILVTDTKYLPGSSSGLSEKVNLNKLEFNAANNTAYNYWQVGFLVVLESGMSNVAAVNRYNLSEFMSGKTKKIEIVWPGNLPPISQISITPEVNIFKTDNYIKY